MEDHPVDSIEHDTYTHDGVNDDSTISSKKKIKKCFNNTIKQKKSLSKPEEHLCYENPLRNQLS